MTLAELVLQFTSMNDQLQASVNDLVRKLSPAERLELLSQAKDIALGIRRPYDETEIKFMGSMAMLYLGERMIEVVEDGSTPN